MMYVLPLFGQLLIHSVSKFVSVFALCLMVSLFPFPAHQPTPEGHCHVAMYISLDLQLLAILIWYAIYDPSLSTDLTVWVFTFFPTVASLQKIGLCHILTSVRMIFFTSLFSENLSRLTLALASPTSFRHLISSSIMGFFLWSSHVRLLQPEA